MHQVQQILALLDPSEFEVLAYDEFLDELNAARTFRERFEEGAQ